MFENSLFRIVAKCRIKNYKIFHSTNGSVWDDPTCKDIFKPDNNPTWKGWDAYMNGAPPEFVAKSEDVNFYALVITRILNSTLFYPPSLEGMKHTWPKDAGYLYSLSVYLRKF